MKISNQWGLRLTEVLNQKKFLKITWMNFLHFELKSLRYV